jgi:hypothetical protein
MICLINIEKNKWFEGLQSRDQRCNFDTAYNDLLMYNPALTRPDTQPIFQKHSAVCLQIENAPLLEIAMY